MAFNAAAKVAPAASIFGVRQGFATYDQAIAAGKSPAEATRLAWCSGLIEGATTVAFSAIPGAGGLESITAGSAREAFRRTLGESVRSAWKEGAKAFGKGVLGEMGEEELIAALDTAFVQTQIHPGMTDAQFMKRLYDTGVTTVFASGGFAAAHGRNVYKDTLENNRKLAGEMDDSGMTAKPRPKVEITAEQQAQVTEAYYQKALSSRVANTDDVRSLIPGYNEADPLTRDADYHKAASAINDAIIDPTLSGDAEWQAGDCSRGRRRQWQDHRQWHIKYTDRFRD